MRSIAVICIFTISLSANGQEQADSTHKVDLATIATVNQGNSYITFPTDIGNIEPLWFEANIIPNFMIRESKNSRLMGVLTPQIIIRMYRVICHKSPLFTDLNKLNLKGLIRLF